jgi:membrane protease YdiL (CAAX protease family)
MQPEIRPSESVPPGIETLRQNAGLWGGWPTIGLGIAIFAIYFVAQALVAIPFVIHWFITGASSPQSISKLMTNGNLISITTIVSATVGVGFIILFIKIRKGTNIRDYLELKSVPKKTFLVLVAVVIGLVILSSVLDQVLHAPQDTEFTVDAYTTTSWPVLFWIAVAVFAPLFEESFFRGFIFVGLKQTGIGAAGTIALTSLTWALLHIQYDIYGMTTILVLGIAFGIIRLKTGSLLSTLFLHSMWNILAMVGTILYINGILH